ncbi:MAG: DUF554 domain-containing protein [Clostridiales bacterium]|nr:DUF554 domain-containing protein [Clostridiales bacterium]
MLGTIVNTCCILTGSVVGSLVKRGLKPEYQSVPFTACGLAATGLGINSVVQNMPNSQYPVLFIISLALGGLVGTALDLNGRFHRLTESRSGSGSRLGEGMSTAILLFCIGTLSILGPINSALYGDNTYLFTNATLDLVTSMVLASTYGIGIAIAGGVLFCWQGAIYLLGTLLGSFMTEAMMTEISIVGGFLIASSGLGILGIRDCKTLNLLPALVVPVIWVALAGWLGI